LNMFAQSKVQMNLWPFNYLYPLRDPDRPINKLEKQGIKPKMLRWYVIRAEQYLKAFPDRIIADHRPDDVQAYLQKIGRKQGLEDWQYYQIVDAIQNLFQLTDVKWVEQVDWEFWKSSAYGYRT